jgi:hypothetical protein
MSFVKRAKEKPKFPNSVILPWDMVTHKAYLDLPPSSCKELPFFLKKVKRKLFEPERYADAFEFSYREANRYGFPISTHHRTILKLMAHGFIDPVAKGGLKSEGRSCNRFRLSERWRKYGTPEFMDIQWETFIQQDTKKHKATAKLKMRNRPTESVLEI